MWPLPDQLRFNTHRHEWHVRMRNWNDSFATLIAVCSGPLFKYLPTFYLNIPKFSRKMKSVICFVFFGIVALSRADIKEEEDVLVLESANFEEALTNEFILVEFCEYQYHRLVHSSFMGIMTLDSNNLINVDSNWWIYFLNLSFIGLVDLRGLVDAYCRYRYCNSSIKE